MLDTVPWFGFVPHYQSQLAGGTQLRVVQIRPGLFAFAQFNRPPLRGALVSFYFALFRRLSLHT